ncbi:MAG: hypothetical protein AAFV07_05040 [Bacteroidota bacterium]
MMQLVRLDSTYFFLGGLIIWLFSNGCRPTVPPDEVFGNDLLGNVSVEEGDSLPNFWVYSEGDSTVMLDNLWTSEESFEGLRALKISRSGDVLAHYTWRQTLVNRIQRDRPLLLKVMIKTENLTEPGAALLIRGDNTDEPKGAAEQSASTQGKLDIMATQDWTEYSLRVPEGLGRGLESLSVYLVMLPETNGTVYFDQMTLEYEE